MKKLIFTLLAALCLLGVCGAAADEVPYLQPFALRAQAVVESGTCGENITWEFNSESGVLTISGTGEMPSYSSAPYYPWYAYKNGVKTVIISEGVQSVGFGAFDMYPELTAVRVPSSVQSWGGSVFAQCKKLTSVTLAQGLKTLGKNTFGRCSALTSVSLPDSLETISVSAFADCSALTAITIPSSVRTIEEYAFNGCKKLQSIRVPDSVTVIGKGAFLNCTELESVVLSKNITALPDNLFDGCASLKTAEIPVGVTKVGNYVYRNCTALESAVFPSGVTEIGGVVFHNCSKLTSVSLPESVTAIGSSFLLNCTALKSIRLPDALTALSDYFFSGCSSLVNVTLPSDVQRIGKEAFRNCTALQSVVLPDSVLHIRDSAFRGCTALQTVRTGNAVQAIDSYAFRDCTSLQSFRFPDAVTAVNSYVFQNCTSLESIYLSAKIASFNYFSVEGCTALLRYETAADNATYTAADGVLFSKDMTRLYRYPAGCTAKEYIVPDSVTYMEHMAFQDSAVLESVVLSPAVRSTGQDVFNGCLSLKEVTLSEKMTTLETGMFRDCTALEAIAVPTTVTTIKSSVFSGCTSLRKAVLSDNLASVGSYAFGDCTALTDVYYTGTATEWEDVSITSSGNQALLDAKMHYNAVYDFTNGNSDILAAADTQTLAIITRNTDSWLSGTAGNQSLVEKSGSLNWKMADSTAKIGSRSYSQDEKKIIRIAAEDITDDIVLSHDGYYNYIIPKTVALSFINAGLENVYEHTAYMKKEVRNGKPYVSTVFARRDGATGVYTDIRRETMTVADGFGYTFFITPDNLSEAATYYISQDDAHRVQSTNGCFSIDHLSSVLQSGKDTYVYFVTASGVASDPVQIKLKFENPEENAVVKELKKGKLNIGGQDGLSITLPEDWILIGGSTIDLCAWSFPVGVQVDGDKVRVSVGFDLWTSETTTEHSYSSVDKQTQYEYVASTTTEYKTTTLWENMKNGVKGTANAFKKAANEAEAVRIKKQLCERYGVDVADLGSSKVTKTKMNVSSLGYIEGQIINGKFIVTEMLISVAGEFTMSYTVQLSQGYLGIEGGGKLTVTTNWSRATADLNLPLEFGFTVNVTPEIKARGGIGWDGLASAGVYGKGTMPIDVAFKQKRLSVALTGEFGYEAEFLVWKTGEKALLNGTFGPKEIYWGQSAVQRANAVQAQQTQTENVGERAPVYTLTPRRQTGAWLGINSMTKLSGRRIGVSSAEELTFRTLQNDVFRLSEADIISAGDTTLAVWITESDSRDDYNRLMLVYSVYDKLTDTWSAPSPVHDDGYTDASPVLATDGERVFAAWQKYYTTFNAESGSDLTAVLSAAEICTAEFDTQTGRFTAFTRLTDDKVYDYRPALTVKNGEAVCVYASSTDNRLMSADSNRITKCENGSKTVLAQNLATVNRLACAVTDNTVSVAYAADTDGNLQTTSDIAVFYGSDSFTEFEKYYADDVLTDFVFADMDGKTTLFVSDGLNIYYRQNGETKAVFEEETIISSPVQAVNEPNGLSFWWLSASENGNELYVCNRIDGEWSNAVCLSGRGNMFSCLAVTLCDNQVIGIANETDSDTAVTNFMFFRENDRFDLAMQAVSLDETHLQVGQTAFLDVTVTNTGNVMAESLTFTVRDAEGTDKTYLVDRTLLPGKTLLWKIPYVIRADFAKTQITVSVSAEGQTDHNSENDAFVYTPDRASLVVQGAVSEEDGIYVLSADLSNVNFAVAEDVTAVISFEKENAAPVCTLNVGSLAKDALGIVEFAFSEKDLTFDEQGVAVVYLTVCAANAEPAVAAYAITAAQPPVMKGDVDENGKVEAADARLALRASVRLEQLTDRQQQAADVDGTAGVSASDARRILRVSVKLETF